LIPPPLAAPPVIYLAFTIDNNNDVLNWYNIEPNCTINTSLVIDSTVKGKLVPKIPTSDSYFTYYGGSTPLGPGAPILKTEDIIGFNPSIVNYGYLYIQLIENTRTKLGLNVYTGFILYPGSYVISNEPIIPCCFSEGTKILGLTAQLKEEYRLVQDLLIGDFVKSYLHGYRRISKIISGSFVNNPNDQGVSDCMYIMLKTDDNGLSEDLTLTRNHGVLVEKLSENEEKKVDINNLPIIDGLLSISTADSDKFEKLMDTNVYKYYHFSLETDGDNDRRFGVWANGLLVEVPSNNMMDNALNIKPLDF